MNIGNVVVALVAACLSPLVSAQTGPGATDRSVTGQSAAGRNAMIPGTIGGIDPAVLGALNLTEEQRAQVTKIQRELKRKQWDLIGSLRELRWKHQDALSAPEFDPERARKTFEAIVIVRREMFEAALNARMGIESALTKEQREQLRKRSATKVDAGGGVMGTDRSPAPR